MKDSCMEKEIRIRFLRLLFVHLLVFLAAHCGAVFRADAAQLPYSEVVALKQIANKLGQTKWNISATLCSPNGGWNKTDGDQVDSVTCDCSYKNGTVCHIVSILQKSLNLTGVLPQEFANLTFLHTLDLTRNYLNGSLPAKWASLPLITDISILGNRLSGSIPKEFGSMKNLVSLVLEANQLEGQLPPELGNLKNLERFLIGSNNFRGELPATFAKLTNLTDFRIHGNNFSGKIPDYINNWTRLSSIMIFGTSMEGPIPDISSLTNLTELRITDIKGTASELPLLPNLQKLKTVILRNCLLYGQIPYYIGSMKTLKTLDLSFNNLTGEIPTSFESLKKLDFMYLTSNKLSGTVPGWTKTSQKQLDLSNNTFTGAPNAATCPGGNLNMVGSYSSTEDKSIDPCLKKDFPCHVKPRNYNLFINCGGNEYSINDTKYEADLDQRGAALSYIVKDKWAFSSTGNFMGNNYDADDYITTNKSRLDIPHRELYMNARVSPLALTYYGLCLQNGNYTVRLHFAEIVFTDNKTFSSLGKRIFDVSIQGTKVLNDFNIEEEAGGPGRALIKNLTATVTSNTLEIQFYWAGKGTISIPDRGVYGPLISAISVTPDFTPDLDDENALKLPALVIVMIVLAGCVIFSLIIVILRLKGWLGGKVAVDKELRGQLEQQTGYFTLKQIKAATNNFDAENKIGEGGFGPVYKGVLPDGGAIAVKVLSAKSKQGNKEFVTEIGMISALQHPNLVKLLGCCIENNQLMLVYEYLVNNSLARALFSTEGGCLKLDWPTRCKICIGVARGLAYLHEESRLKVVHRDIKATNVLLDKDLNAKISDFGLAKLEEEGQTHISTRIAGTIGYMAPEYAMRGYLTDKADVYSFGVVAMEIVSGKSNTNYRPKDEFVYLLDWAYVLQEKGNLLDLVDPNLGKNYSKEEALRMLKVSLLCTSPSPTLRPSMSTVVSMLEGHAPVHEPAPTTGPFSLSGDWRLGSSGISSATNTTGNHSAEGGPQTEVTEQWNDASAVSGGDADNNSTLLTSKSSQPKNAFEIDVK